MGTKLILGGGLGGLSAAFYLCEGGSGGVHLVEKANRLGGWVQTVVDKETGLLLETGPHTVRPSGLAGRNTLHLVAKLGLVDDVVAIPSGHPAATKRLLCVDSTLYTLPSSLSSLFKTCPPFSKPLILSVLKDLFTPPINLKDESAYSFFERRFGSDVAKFGISPMLSGICAGDAQEISIKSLMPTVFEAEQSHGSVIKGVFLNLLKPKMTPEMHSSFPDAFKWNCWTLKNGMSSLINSLHKYVSQCCKVSLNSNLSNLDLQPGSVTCDINGKRKEFSHLISAVPASSLAPLLQKQHPHLSKYLSEIFSVSVIVVNLIFDGQHLRQPAFGFLVPPSENKSLLGVIFDSCILPQGDKTVLTAMLGGRWFDNFFSSNTSQEEIRNVTLSHVKSILGITESPLSCHISVHKNCIPQYVLGHSERVLKINKYIRNNNLPISLVGSSYNGIGINDVILSAKLKTEDLLWL